MDCQTDGNFLGAVEYLKDGIANEAAELTLGSLARRQFNAPVPGVASGADDIGFLHALESYQTVAAYETEKKITALRNRRRLTPAGFHLRAGAGVVGD
jgi:hypothetical protein